MKVDITDDWGIVGDNCLKYYDIEDVFSLSSRRLARFTYTKSDTKSEGDAERDFHIRLELDSFRNNSDDCFKMYLDENLDKTEVCKSFMLSTWIEGRDKKRHFTSSVSVEESNLCVWTERRDVLLEKYENLKKIKDGSASMTFAFKFEPVSDSSLESKQENDVANNHEGCEPLNETVTETGIEDVISLCKDLLDKENTRPDKNTRLELQCGEDIFPLIKTDLQRRCETFAEDMLSRNIIRNRVKVTDMESGVLAVLLMNICFEKVASFPSDLAPEVFHCSIKYKLPNLVARSISVMTRHLEENAIEYLLPFAVTCGKDFMPELISTMKNPEEIFESNAWSNFAPEHKAWACEAYKSYFTKCLK